MAMDSTKHSLPHEYLWVSYEYYITLPKWLFSDPHPIWTIFIAGILKAKHGFCTMNEYIASIQ